MIPKYDDIMFPFLKLISDEKVWEMKNLEEELSKYFKLTDNELTEVLKNGTPIFKSRVGWARAYLKAAKLIDSPERGRVLITQRGKEVLNTNIKKIDRKFLMQFAEFREFSQYKRDDKILQNNGNNKDFNELSPEEKFELIYNELESSLISDILSIIEKIDFKTFEKIVSDVLLKMGYGINFRDAVKLTGGVGDEGIDAIIKQDPLGLDNIYIQAKRWKGSVGRPEIQKFVGALYGKGASKGVFITSGEFSEEAKRYVSNLSNIKVILIDGKELASLMVKYNIGLSIYKTFELKKIDSDYFDNY